MKNILAISVISFAAAVANASSDSLTSSTNMGKIETGFGKPTFRQKLFYLTMYDKKTYPVAEIFYYDNGIYKIISEGEEHYGVYVLQGKFSDRTYNVRYISLPSKDWGEKTAYHHLTFINDYLTQTFVQNAIIDTGEDIPQQHGTFTLEKNSIEIPIHEKWVGK